MRKQNRRGTFLACFVFNAWEIVSFENPKPHKTKSGIRPPKFEIPVTFASRLWINTEP